MSKRLSSVQFEKIFFSRVFDTTMAFFAVLIILLYLSELYLKDETWTAIVLIVENIIICIFAIEYFFKLYLAKNKLEYIRTHWIELLSILPFSALFQSLRLIRFLRILLLLRFTFIRLESFFKKNVLLYGSFITFSIVILAAFAVFHFEQQESEPAVRSIGDALWWSWVTTTTVGYGDITPKTTGGRIVAAILMLVGISFLGVLTGTIASYFIRTFDEHESVHDATLSSIIQKIRHINKLKREDVEELHQLLMYIWEKEQQKKEKQKDLE